MARFVDYFKLWPIDSPNDFLGIAPDKEKDNIIVSIGRNIVVIKASTQKQIHIWFIPKNLSSKVIYDRRLKKYVGVFSKCLLRCWDEQTADVEKCKPFKFHKVVVELISAGEESLVLYNDGTFEKLSVAMTITRVAVEPVRLQLAPAPNYTLSNARVTTFSDGRQVLTYFERQADSGELVAVRASLDSEHHITRFSLNQIGSSNKVVAYTIVEGDDDELMALTLWSDKRIRIHQLDETTRRERSPSPDVATFAELNINNPFAITAVSRHLVAMYGARSDEDGAYVLLYNTQYHLVKTKQYFKVYFDFSRLWAFDENVYLATGQNLTVLPYVLRKDLLADVIGTQIRNEPTVDAQEYCINEELALSGGLRFTTTAQTKPFKNATKRHPVARSTTMADGKTVPLQPPEFVESELNELCKLAMQVETTTEVPHLIRKPIVLVPNPSGRAFKLELVELIASYMKQNGASEQEITERIFGILIKANLDEELVIGLQRYSNISEKMLAQILHYVLKKMVSISSEDSPKLNGHGRSKLVRKTIAVPDAVALTELLNAVLACSFNFATLTSQIQRGITYQQVLLLLDHLYSLLTSSKPIDSTPPFSALDASDFQAHIVRWVNVIVGVHFQTLRYGRDAELNKRLYKWQQLINSYRQEERTLRQVSTLLLNLLEQKKKPQRRCLKWYTIEEVPFFA